ncbi:MAG TPA: hypothetical protein VMM80_00485 [Bacteroidota bacterium]|nr:hypothetical protein [Bacteroidota bacterium]
MKNPTPLRQKAPAPAQDLPLYCDYQCPHASFAPPDATGACRREQGVYCGLIGSFNTKNSPCKARRGAFSRSRGRRVG